MKEKTKHRKQPAHPAAHRCSECAGTLKPAKFSNFDFTQWAGLPVYLAAVPGLRCDSCGGKTLPGIVINQLLATLAICIVRLPHRLPATEARYLRRCLQITQQELADRMGIVRETVAQWETATKEISSQHDLILRTLLLNKFFGEDLVSPERLVATMMSLAAVKSAPPPRKMQPLLVPASEYMNMKKQPSGRLRRPVPIRN